MGTVSNIGGERDGRRLADCGRNTLLESSMVDEEISRVSEGSLTSLVDATEQRNTSQLSVGGRGTSKNVSREYLRPRQDAP